MTPVFRVKMVRHLLIKIAVVSAILYFTAGADAQEPTGSVTTEWFYHLCKSSEKANQLPCSFYLAGAANVMRMLGTNYMKAAPGPDRDFVAPFQVVGMCGKAAGLLD